VDYTIKPFTSSAIAARVMTHLKLHRQHRVLETMLADSGLTAEQQE